MTHSDPPLPTPGALHPSGWLFRAAILALVGLMSYGSYFAYDSIGALAPTLIQIWHTDRESVGLLYTAYNAAAIVSVLFAGILTDRIGTRRASVLFSAFIIAGAAVVALAPGVGVAVVGRFVFGAGSEALIVATTAILARWFAGRWLAFSFGLTLSISRLGSLLSFNTESLVASRFGWQAALWVAVGLCVASLVCTLLYGLLDRRGERALSLPLPGSDRVAWRHVVRFGPSYWLVVALCVTFYCAIFPFTSLSTDFFHDKWGLPLTADRGGSFLAAVFQDLRHMFSTAPGTTSIVIFASMLLSPFAGTLVDRIGRRAGLMALGSLLTIPCFVALGLRALPPFVPMIGLGAAFVLVPAAMWPAVPLIVERERVGTAFGLMTMVQNVGLALFSWLNGLLRDRTGDYAASMAMFACLGLFGLVLSALLWRRERREGGVLERPAAVPAQLGGG